MRRICPSFLLGLAVLWSACASVPPSPPTLPPAPGIPDAGLDAPPSPPLPPAAPQAPQFTLPKPTDVDWRTLWQQDFANDGQPQPMPKLAGAVGLLFAGDAPLAFRFELSAGLLALGFANADFGLLVANQVSCDDKQGSLAHAATISDPLGLLAVSPLLKNPAVQNALIVRELVFEGVERPVRKFDVEKAIAELADYNEKVVAYESRARAYAAARAQYESAYGRYAAEFGQWRSGAEAKIAGARRRYAEEVAAWRRDFEASYAAYVAKLNGAAPAGKPATDAPDYWHASLPEAAPQAAASRVEALTPLSLDQMRTLLADMATERVPSRQVRLLGQFVSVGTGLAVATVDAQLCVPQERGWSDARLLRELLQMLAQ